MKNPATVSWNLRISRDDVQKLLRGFKPAAMEDRWMCRADPPDTNGSFVVHMHRSWTGVEVFRMNVVLAVPGGNTTSAHTEESHETIKSLTWDKGDGSYVLEEREAKDLAIDVCRGVLKCDL